MLTYNSIPQAVAREPPSPADFVPDSNVAAAIQQKHVVDPVPEHQGPPHHHIWLVTGPAGSGKSTVAEFLAKNLDLPFLEGDNFHSPASVEKMANGQPLTDADRWDWLTLLREEALQQLSAGASGVVVTCSALKKKYRDVIRVAPYKMHNVRLHFVFLHASEKVLTERVMNRKGHYMAANMVHSQFDILEAPEADETDVISIDVSGTSDEVKSEALRQAYLSIEDEMQSRD